MDAATGYDSAADGPAPQDDAAPDAPPDGAHFCRGELAGGSGGTSLLDGGCEWFIFKVNTVCSWTCSCPSATCVCRGSGAPYTVPYAGCPSCADVPVDGGEPTSGDYPCGFVYQ